MSSKKSGNRTLDGAETIEADIINIFEKLEVNGDIGTAHQLLRVNPTADAVEWNNLETLTFTGASVGTYNGTVDVSVNIPAALTATSPIDITGGAISILTNMGSKSLTTTGTLTAEQLTSTDDITATGHIASATLTSSGVIQGGTLTSTAEIFAGGDINANGNIVGDGATNISGILNILPATIGTTGNILCGGNLTGNNTSSSLSLFDSLTLIDGDSFLATNGGDLSLGTGNILGATDIATSTITASSNINANGNIVGDGATNMSGIDRIALVNANSYIDLNGGDILDALDITANGDIEGGTLTSNGNSSLGSANTHTQTIKGDTSFSFLSSTTDWGEKQITKDYRAFKSPNDLKQYNINSFGKSAELRLTGDTNNQLYRSILIKPNDFITNYSALIDDTLSLYNSGDWTSANSNSGGLKPNAYNAMYPTHATAVIDIPEGLKFKAILINVRSALSAGSGFTRPIYLYKRNLGVNTHLGTYNRAIIDYSVSPNYTTNSYAYTTIGAPSEQELSCRYDECYMVKVDLGSVNDIIMGGHLICEPVGDLNWTFRIYLNMMMSFVSDFTFTINGVSQTFTSSDIGGSKVWSLPYNINEFAITCVDTGTRTYTFTTSIGGVNIISPWDGVVARDVDLTHSQTTSIRVSQS